MNSSQVNSEDVCSVSMQAAGLIVNTRIASACSWNDGITHVKCWYVQQGGGGGGKKTNPKHTYYWRDWWWQLVTEVCCHDDSDASQPMAALLSSSDLRLARWHFQLIIERIQPTCLTTYAYPCAQTYSHTFSSQTSHWETQCVFQCLSLVWSSIMHGFGRMKGCFGLRHVPLMKRETSVLVVATVYPETKWMLRCTAVVSRVVYLAVNGRIPVNQHFSAFFLRTWG